MRDSPFTGKGYRFRETPPPATLMEEILATLSDFTEQEREILLKRFGSGTTPQTLQRIADSYGLTRQRILQILNEISHCWKKAPYWNTLVKEVYALLNGRDSPLSLSDAGELEPWLADLESRAVFVQNLINTLCDGHLYVLEIDRVFYFGRIDQTAWDDTIVAAKKLLKKSTSRFWDEETAPVFVKRQLPETAQELGSMLWDKSSALCHFSDLSEEGPRKLVAYGRSAEAAVKAVLSESEEPLYYTEIAERVRNRGKRITIKRTSNAAANVGFLFAPGTFGLKRHIPFTEEEMVQLCTKVEALIMTKPSYRQWHVDEVLKDLRRDPNIESLQGPRKHHYGESSKSSWGVAGSAHEGSKNKFSAESDRYERPLTKYLLEIALRKSQFLRSLGRMTWVAAGKDTEDLKRISIHDSVVALIERAGHPLEVGEIKKKLIEVRGVGKYFNIFPKDPLVRIGPNFWGINDRDVPWSRAKQEYLIEELVSALKKKAQIQPEIELTSEDWTEDFLQAATASKVEFLADEVVCMLDLEGPRPEFPIFVNYSAADAFLSIAAQDPRIRLTQGKKVRLAVPKEMQGPLFPAE